MYKVNLTNEKVKEKNALVLDQLKTDVQSFRNGLEAVRQTARPVVPSVAFVTYPSE